MLDIIIKNGRVVTPSIIMYGAIGIEKGIISYLGSNLNLPLSSRVINAEGHFVIPGLIDPHVHMAGGTWPSLEEGLENQFARETEGAIHGGVTTFGHFISATVGSSLTNDLNTIINIGEKLSFTDFFCHACIVDEGHINEQPELCQKGVTSFKHFFNAYKGIDGMGKFAPCDEGMLYRSFEFLSKWGYPALGMCHCEEMDIVFIHMERLKKIGRKDLLAWTEARPNSVESIRIAHAIEIAKATQCPLYIVHISTAEGSDVVAKARQEGYPVWGETCPHYLTHTGEMEKQVGCWGKVNPSLKYTKDNDALWDHLRLDNINCLATDHGTNTLAYKEQGGGKYNNIWESRPVICGGMEHMLPILMTYGFQQNRISIEDLVRLGSTNTAKVFGLYPRKGILALGSDADIVIIDPSKETIINKDFYHCQCEFGIYDGWKVKGLPRTTLMRGKVLMEDFETITKPGIGRFVPCRAY